MRICVIGTGYVGLVTSACFADFGNQVTGIDNDKKKIASLRKGKIPFYEPGLGEMIETNLQEKRLVFSQDLDAAIEQNEMVVICVGTPTHLDGGVDLSFVGQAAKQIGNSLRVSKIIMIKSTVPVGTNEMVKDIIKQQLVRRKKKISFEVVSNPEFLREGSAVFDALHPSRLIIGSENEEVKKFMAELYRPLSLLGTPIIYTSPRTAELAKYAANAFLATKISFINEIANLCEEVGADVKEIAKAMSYDNRIGGKFLHPGIGYGGSCFPKDTRGLAYQADRLNLEIKIVRAAIKVNEMQLERFCRKIKDNLAKIAGAKVGILGLSFKPNTDDLREAPALKVIQYLLKNKVKVKVFDPVSMPNARKVVSGVEFCRDAYEAAKDCEALVIVTEWNEFRNLDLLKIKKMLKKPVIIDGRNIYEPQPMKTLGFRYVCVGRSY